MLEDPHGLRTHQDPPPSDTLEEKIVRLLLQCPRVGGVAGTNQCTAVAESINLCSFLNKGHPRNLSGGEPGRNHETIEGSVRSSALTS
jgi:hypothetical protein